MVAVSSHTIRRAQTLPPIVLQPRPTEAGMQATDLRASLDAALAEAGDLVIVDLLWIETLSDEAIAALVAAFDQATALGKTLSVRSAGAKGYMALAEAQRQHQQAKFQNRSEQWHPDFERFLVARREAHQMANLPRKGGSDPAPIAYLPFTGQGETIADRHQTQMHPVVLV